MRARATRTQASELWRRTDYEPRHLSEFQTDTHRIKLLSGGEGAGKSMGAAMEVVGQYPYWELVYIVGPKYEACRKEFDYIRAALAMLKLTGPHLISSPARGPCRLETVHGRRVVTLSAARGPDAITGTGESPDMILMVEAGKQPYEIFLACRGRVARSRGLLILSGTIEQSHRWYPELIARWQADNPEGGHSFIVPTWENRTLYPLGRDDPEIKALEATYPPDVFMERFGAVPCPPSSLVFREFRVTEHIKPAPYWSDDAEWRGLPVELAVDPGYASAYAVLAVQHLGDTVWVIDEVYRQFAVAEEVIAECRQRPWWGRVRAGVIDVAGRQHQGLPSHVEIWQRQAGLVLRSRPVRIGEGILRHRTFLRNPATGAPRLFHDPRCINTIREYGRYQYHETEADRAVCEEPIDRDNHALKALAYWLYDRFGPADYLVERARRRGVGLFLQSQLLER